MTMRPTVFGSLALIVFVLSGCSIKQAKEAASLDDVSFSGKDGACSRQCLDTYSTCASRSGETIAVDVQANLLTACKSSLRACVSTCPSAR